MTVFEKQQEQYQSQKEFGEKLSNVLASKSFTIPITIGGREYYGTYNIEFTVENVYTSTGDMIALDVTLKTIGGVNAREWSNTMSKGKYNRLLVDLRNDFQSFMKRDILIKTATYGTRIIHLNSVNN